MHDYLVQMGGAERVVASMLKLYPGAPLFTSITAYKGLIPELRDAAIINSFLQSLPAIERIHKLIFPLYPTAFRSLNLSGCDVALISSSGFSKWVSLPAETVAICYCHAPPRFIWDTEAYLENEIGSRLLKSAARQLLALMKDRDLNRAKRMDHFIANSNYIKEKIAKIYGREATVIYPPVAVDELPVSGESRDYYLILSRLVGYKHLDIAIRAFAKNGRQLVIIGDGPDRARLEAMAAGRSNIRFLGLQTREQVRDWLCGAYAVITPSLDDFGIVPVEANACGKPVLAYGKGGVLETVIPGVTGEFFFEPTEEAINDLIGSFETKRWDPRLIRKNAERFSEASFQHRLREFVDSRSTKENGAAIAA